MRYIFFFLALVLYPNFLIGQVDSILPMDRLEASDINYDQIFTSFKVISASRSLKSIDDLPFSIHVISREDILKNGFMTLVDVLKYLPGMKVSQPGSAIEGETFYMQGLFGNAYTKILINDLPVKPTVVNGMPLGAQLPIRQAERIEIIYGTGAAIYGADASAGIINIITRDSEQPLYAQSDLVLGTDNYNALNVMVGGKLGRNKNILKFKVYGSSTQRDDQPVKYQTNTLYNPDNYFFGSQLYLKSDNYRGEPGEPILGELPHLSRMLGLDLQFRGFKFGYHKMYRRDHSALGQNPAAVSYATPLNFIGESIDRYNLNFSHDFGQFSMTTNLTYLRYQMDNQSSYAYIKPTVANIIDTLISTITATPFLRDSLLKEAQERFFSDSRFSYAESNDYYLEQLINYYPNPIIEVVGGVSYRFSQNFPILNFLRNPFSQEVNFNSSLTNRSDAPIFPNAQEFDNFGAFTQVYLTLNRLNLIGGLRWDNDERFGNELSPRFATMYKIADNLRFRFSFGQAFRTPTLFYNSNTYIFTANNLLRGIRTGRQNLQPERTRTFEMGLRWLPKTNLRIDGRVFRTETTNFISYNFETDFVLPAFDNNAITIGYFNDEDSRVLLYGIQTNLEWKQLIPDINLGLEAHLTYSLGEEVLPFNNGTIDQVRTQPEWQGHLHVFAQPIKNFDVGLRFTGSSSWLKRIALDDALLNNALDAITIDGYSTIDLYGRWLINSNFQVSVQINNLLDEEYGGISATGFLDDLNFNPQPLAQYRIGLNYLLN